MKNLALVRKYAAGLAQALKDEPEYAAVGAEIQSFLDLFLASADLRKALTSPFVNVRRREAILDEVLARLRPGGKTSRFLKLLLEHKRLDLLPDIVRALPEAWSEKLGVVTFEVASAAPLTEAQQDRLRRRLEDAERRPVRLVFAPDPGLIGGLAVRKGNIVYDASVEGELAALQERLGQI